MSENHLPCRLLIDPPAAGAWNMAVDELLLDSAAEGRASLRFYQWNEATLSLGYFQRFDEREQHTAGRCCAVVRRLTGGGAIVHDQELTYALALPRGQASADDRDRLYSLAHRSLLAALAEKGLRAEVFCPCEQSSRREEDFLCFQRRTRGDVILSGMKIAGSAQRRRRGAVLQHGSVLLARSSAAPELPGIVELSGVELSPLQLIERWQPLLAEAIGLQLDPQPLSPEERRRAELLVGLRYGNRTWTEGRGKADST